MCNTLLEVDNVVPVLKELIELIENYTFMYLQTFQKNM
jgi:hypothetical protein